MKEVKVLSNPMLRMDITEIENPFGFVWLQLCINYNDKVAGKCESNCCEDACSIKRRIEINIFRLQTNSNDVKELEEVQRFVPSRRKWFGGNTNGAIFKLEENESYLLEVWFSPTALKFTRVSQQKLFAVRILLKHIISIILSMYLIHLIMILWVIICDFCYKNAWHIKFIQCKTKNEVERKGIPPGWFANYCSVIDMLITF